MRDGGGDSGGEGGRFCLLWNADSRGELKVMPETNVFAQVITDMRV